LLLAVLFSWCAGAAWPALAQDAAPEVREMFAEWKKRLGRVNIVRYQVAGELVFPKGCFTTDAQGKPLKSPLPRTDVACPKKYSLLLDLSTDRFRLDAEEHFYSIQTETVIRTHGGVSAFGGKELQSEILWQPNTGRMANDPDVDIGSGNLRGAPIPSEYWPIFFGHGIIPTATENVIPGRFQPPLEEDEFLFHGRGVHAGRNCVVIRTEAKQFSAVGYDEYWADPDREGAVLRYVSYLGGKAVVDIDISYQQGPHGWLPHHWTMVRRDKTGQTMRVERLRVEEVIPDVPVQDADFQVEIKPGMLVRRIDYGGSGPALKMQIKMFRVDEDGSWIEIGKSPEQRRRWLAFVWWGAGLGGLALLAWLALRRRRRQRGAQAPPAAASG
jgi:hypothetical protein